MAKAYLYSLTDTWDNAATTFNAIRMSVTDTASAAGSLLFDLQRNATTAFSVAKTGVVKIVETASGRDLQIQGSTTGAFHRLFSSNTSAGFSFENNAVVLGTLSATTGLGIGSGGDLFLNRDAANTLAQRNGTSAQTFRVYNTYTDASNYEFGALAWSGNTLFILTARAGTGTARPITFRTDSNNRWTIGGGDGHFIAGADNTYDIGASGANRPRDVYAAGTIYAGVNLGLSSNNGLLAFGSSFDTVLARDAANTLAQRNGTNAQAFRVYNTYTDASNYERGEISWSGNVLTFGTTAAGTGTGRPVLLRGSPLNFAVGGGPTTVWQINASGHFLAAADNTYDIGASGANRPRNVIAGTTVRAPEMLTDNLKTASGGGGLLFTSPTQAALTQSLTAASGVAIPAGGTASTGLMVSSTANFGVFFGSGAPTLSAAKGSLYLRSDGTTTNDRMYVNTNGSTTWTAVTTAA